jgi:hypothetical protein
LFLGLFLAGTNSKKMYNNFSEFQDSISKNQEVRYSIFWYCKSFIIWLKTEKKEEKERAEISKKALLFYGITAEQIEAIEAEARRRHTESEDL